MQVLGGFVEVKDVHGNLGLGVGKAFGTEVLEVIFVQFRDTTESSSFSRRVRLTDNI